jgi:hypothetical protein
VTENRDSSVDKATGNGLDGPGFGARARYFSSPHLPDLYVLIVGALSRGLKLPAREADHSPPGSEEVKKMWIYTSTSPYIFMA